MYVGTLAIFYMWAHWPNHRIQLYWLHEYMSIRMRIQLYVGILAQYGYTNPCMWAHWPSFICGHTGPTTEYNYTDYMSIPAQTWVHEHTSPNIITWAYQPKREYMSIPAQTWVHEHISPDMSTWAYQPKPDYMSIPAQTWVHEHISPNMSTWAYQPITVNMNISVHNSTYEHISP